MGLRDKVALVLVTAVITQITIVDCMPSSSRKASFQHYLDSFKPGKTNSVARPSFNKESCKSIKPTYSKCKNAKLRQETRPDKSLYEVFNFPETEYSFDILPRDPFYSGTTFKTNAFGLSNKQNTNPQSEAFNNLRKQMRMKRKLSRSTNYNTNSEMPSCAFSPVPELIWSKDPAMFPDVQYPTNAMETWMPHYWNPTLFNPYGGKNSEFPVCDPKLSENTTIFYKPYKQQFKSKTQQFMEQIEKLKEKMRNASRSVPIVNTSESNTNSSTYGEIAGYVINSDLNNNNVSPANVEPAVYNQTQIIPSNIDETPVTPIPIPYKGFGQNDMCPVKDPQSIQNDATDNTNETNNPPLTETEPIDETESIVNNATLTTNNGENQSESIENPPTGTPPENAPNDTGNGTSTDNNGSEPLDIDPTKPTDINTTNSTPNSIPVEELKEGPINKMPYSSVFVVPVGNSISKIQLPTIESNTGAPIILLLPSRSNNDEFTIPSNNPFSDIICDTCSNIQPTPMEYILEIPSAIWNGDFEMLPNNSMCYISTKTVNNNTSVTKSSNPPDISQPDNSGDGGSNNGEADIVPTNSATNDTSVPNDTTSSENSQPGNSTTLGGNNGQSETAPTETANNDTSILDSTDPPETAQASNSGDSESNSGHSKNVPTDMGTNETSVSKDTNPSEDVQPVNSTPPGGGNGQGKTAPANTESTSPPETTQIGNSGDSASNNGPTENVPNDTESKETSAPENSQPDDSTASAENNVSIENAPTGTVGNDTSVTESTNSSETSYPGNSGNTGSNDGQTEMRPTDAGTNVISFPKDITSSESSQPDNSTALSGDDAQSEPALLDTIKNDTPVPGGINPLETAQPTNFGDSGTNNPSENSQPDESTASGENNGQIETVPNEDAGNDTSVPESMDQPETLQPVDSTNKDSDIGQTDTAPTYNNDTNNTTSTENAQSDNSTGLGENSEETETAPSDTGKNDTTASKDTTSPETFQFDNTTESEGNDEQTETVPSEVTNNDTLVPKNTILPETSQPVNSLATQPNTELNEITPTNILDNDTPLTKDKGITEANQNVDPNTILDDKSLPVDTEQPLTSLTDNNLGAKMDKGLSNDVVPNTVDDKLPLNAPTDNINDLGLDKGLQDTAITNIVSSDKTLPTGMDLPLTLLTDSPKISELDKRLADTTSTFGENDSPSNTDLPETGPNKSLTNTSRKESVKDKATLSNINKENSVNDDGQKSKIDKNPAKQLKAKFVYTCKSQSNIYDHQKPSDVTVPLFKDDNPVRVDIEVPLNSLSDRKLVENKITNNNKPDIHEQLTSSSGNIRSENTLGEDKASISMLDKMSRDAHQKSDLQTDEAIEDFSENNIGTIHSTLAPSLRDESVSTNKELTSAELKDLIKYLYISV